MVNSPELTRAHSLIVTTPDFPEPGILFRDISPLLADGAAMRTVINAMIAPFAGTFDVVAGVEARGFLLAGAVAVAAGVGMVPIRKAGKLPRPAASMSYDLEYGKATIEMAADLPSGARVLLVDDVLATGGTVAATRELVERCGGVCVGVSVLMELSFLEPRSRTGDLPVSSLLTL